MRGRLPLVAMLLAVACGAGCSTGRSYVEFDAREDFSAYRTWAWMPRPTPNVEAPHLDAQRLDAALTQLIEQGLSEKALDRGGARAADLFVTYRLELRAGVEVVSVPLAAYTLHSHHSSPSYTIEGTHEETRVYQDLLLWIGAAAPDGRMVWHGAWKERVPAGAALPLQSSVSHLLARFPARGPAVVGSEP